uniref:Prokineticin domain-containing protein n=1 Tax=Xiphophorus couchianus TaxID=32473 RepID=A0A3B5LK47_9TELE
MKTSFCCCPLRETLSCCLNCCLIVPLLVLQTCEKDEQCGHLECCAVSLWKSNQRMCISLGVEGDECHPSSFKQGLNPPLRFSKRRFEVPYSGIRQEHTCPCLPNLTCNFSYDLFKCIEDLKK